MQIPVLEERDGKEQLPVAKVNDDKEKRTVNRETAQPNTHYQ